MRPANASLESSLRGVRFAVRSELSTASRPTQWRTLLNFTMAEVVLDANVIVALLYADDSQHQRAVDLTERLEAEGHSLVLVDFLLFEALSVLCRRAAQRKTAPPDLAAAIATMRNWFDGGEVRFLAHEWERLAASVLDIVTDSAGLLNANDALLVALQHEGAIDTLATFDRQFENVAELDLTS